MKVEDFKNEIEQAVATYDRYIVCIDKTPDQFLESIRSLITKAIKVFENRAPGLKHGIALDAFVTVILSEPPEATEESKPLCGIYFNLHSPYKKKSASAKSKA